MALLVLSLRGAVAIVVLTTLVGGIPRVVQVGLAAALGLWAAVMLAPTETGQALIAASGLAGSGLAGSGGVANAVAGSAPTWVVALGEVALGAALGVMSAVPLLAAAAAGQVVDLASSSRASGPYSTFFGVLAAAVFVGIDGHVTVMTSLVESHQGMASVAGSLVGVLAMIAKLVPAAVKLSVPWLVTAAVVQISMGVGMRVGGRAAAHAPVAAAVPAALVMMTASLVATLAIAMAALFRGAW